MRPQWAVYTYNTHNELLTAMEIAKLNILVLKCCTMQLSIADLGRSRSPKFDHFARKRPNIQRFGGIAVHIDDEVHEALCNDCVHKVLGREAVAIADTQRLEIRFGHAFNRLHGEDLIVRAIDHLKDKLLLLHTAR